MLNFSFLTNFNVNANMFRKQRLEKKFIKRTNVLFCCDEQKGLSVKTFHIFFRFSLKISVTLILCNITSKPITNSLMFSHSASAETKSVSENQANASGTHLPMRNNVSFMHRHLVWLVYRGRFALPKTFVIVEESFAKQLWLQMTIFISMLRRFSVTKLSSINFLPLTCIALCDTLPGSLKDPSLFCCFTRKSSAWSIILSSTNSGRSSRANMKHLATNAVSHVLPDLSLLPKALYEPSACLYLKNPCRTLHTVFRTIRLLRSSFVCLVVLV